MVYELILTPVGDLFYARVLYYGGGRTKELGRYPDPLSRASACKWAKSLICGEHGLRNPSFRTIINATRAVPQPAPVEAAVADRAAVTTADDVVADGSYAWRRFKREAVRRGTSVDDVYCLAGLFVYSRRLARHAMFLKWLVATGRLPVGSAEVEVEVGVGL